MATLGGKSVSVLVCPPRGTWGSGHTCWQVCKCTSVYHGTTKGTEGELATLAGKSGKLGASHESCCEQVSKPCPMPIDTHKLELEASHVASKSTSSLFLGRVGS